MAKIVSGVDYLALPSSPDTWLIEPLLPSGGAMLLYGDPKVGKSYSALQLAEAIQTGSSWMGFPCRAGKVAYLQFDTPRNVWQDRIRKLVKAGAMTSLPALGDRESLECWPFDILNPEHLIIMREELQELMHVDTRTGEQSIGAPDLVIIDTLRESHSADENDSTEMQKAIAALVAATQPAAVALVSHSRKPNQDDGFSLMNDNRGSSYVVGRMDAVVRFTPKSVRISGRSIEEHSLDLERADSGFWEVAVGEFEHYIIGVLLDAGLPTIRAKARALSQRIDKSESACRALIRRHLASHPSAPGTDGLR